MSETTLHITTNTTEPVVITDPTARITINCTNTMFVCLVIPKDSTTAELQLEYTVENNATLTLLFLQQSTGEQLQVTQNGTLAAGSTINAYIYSMSSAQTTHATVHTLEGEHATSNIYWQFYGTKQERYSLDARNVCNAPYGGGQMFVRGIAEDTAYVQCNGLIEIGLKGTNTDTYLTEEVLMLDKTAKVDALPGLEIKTNDVKASHSATIHRLTEADLFYFEARGIPEPMARRMYIEGFLEADIEGLPVEAQEMVRGAVQSKMMQMA